MGAARKEKTGSDGNCLPKNLQVRPKKRNFAPHFAKTVLIIYLTDYESIRNRFHFNSRFV